MTAAPLVDRLWYFAPAHRGFPGKAANNIQMMKVCGALAEAGQPTTLVVPRRPETARQLHAAGDLHAMYGITRDVTIEWCPFPYPFRQMQQGVYAPFAALAARRRRVRLAYTRHEWTTVAMARAGIPVICELHHFVENAALRYLFRRAGAGAPIVFVTISRALADLFVGSGCPPARVHVAHDGVDISRFSPRLERDAARRALNLPGGPLVVHAGHLYEGRGIETLLGAASRLPEVTFLFAGGTPADVARHRASAAAAGLANARFVGDVPQDVLPNYLFAADVLAMPYTRRTPTHAYMSPMKLFEYLAAGRPIVASDFPVLHEVLTPDHDVRFVPPADADAFAAAVRALVAEPARAAAMGKAARATALEHTWVLRQRGVLEFAREKLAP